MGINEGLTKTEFLMMASKESNSRISLEIELLRASMAVMDAENTERAALLLQAISN